MRRKEAWAVAHQEEAGAAASPKEAGREARRSRVGAGWAAAGGGLVGWSIGLGRLWADVRDGDGRG